MKEEPVDIKLTNRIKQVFNDFEDPRADTGWQELRKKYPGRKHRHLFFWLGSTAAVLLLATGLWFVKQDINPGAQTVLNKPVKNEKVTEHNKQTQKTNSGLDSLAFSKQELAVESQINTSPAYIKGIKKQPSGQSTLTDFSEQITGLVILTAQENLQPETTWAKTSAEEISKVLAIALKSSTELSFIPILPREKSTVIEDRSKIQNTTDNKNDKTNSKRQKLGFSVFAGSYFNYSEGSESQLNFGAGFTSDIRLSKNLKFSTGLSIASNSLSYDQTLPKNAASSFASLNSGNSIIYSTITSYNADLLTLDIPVNIKYQFVSESDKFYVSAGLSSGTYLAETYAYQYLSFNPSSGNSVSQTQDQKIKKQLNDFDLGRILNLSFGLSTGFGKTQTISIEPFLKYPLGGLGSENLKFGSTGINLKLHFKPVKK